MQPNATLVFQSCLRRNREAARFFDACTPGQKEAILSQLDKVEHMDAFVRHLPQRRPIIRAALFHALSWAVIPKEIHRPIRKTCSAKKSCPFQTQSVEYQRQPAIFLFFVLLSS